VSRVEVPVTLKIRTGPTPETRNGVQIARIAQSEGILCLAVHGRTRSDKFRGQAEYDTIAAIVESVDIPVIANGDIQSADDARRVLRQTGAAGVMIGRAESPSYTVVTKPMASIVACVSHESTSPGIAREYATLPGFANLSIMWSNRPSRFVKLSVSLLVRRFSRQPPECLR